MFKRVLIVGAGPAGAWLAYRLAKENIPVVVLEKERLPRCKPCAGILSNKTVQFFDDTPHADSLQASAESGVHKLVFRHEDDPPLNSISKHGFLLVRRSRFDTMLVEMARTAGARFVTGQKVESISSESGHIVCTTSDCEYRGTVVVGADGANSRVRAEVDGSSAATGIGLQAEVRSDDLLRQYRGEILLDLRPDMIPGGYGWLVPKQEHVSIGIGSVGESPTGLGSSFRRYLDSFETTAQDWQVDRMTGHPLCTFTPRKSAAFAGEGWLCVGDAAAVADPITGEGIYQALMSSEMAYRAICDSWPDRRFQLDYRNLLEAHLFPQLRLAYRLSRVLYRWPSHLYRLVLVRPILLQTFIDVTQGKDTYSALLRQIWQYLPSSLRRDRLARSLRSD